MVLPTIHDVVKDDIIEPVLLNDVEGVVIVPVCLEPVA